MEKYNLALSCLDEVIEKKIFFKDIDLYYSVVYLNYGDFYFKKKKFNSAINCFLKAELFISNTDDTLITDIYIKLASSYQCLGDMGAAKNIYEKLNKKKYKPELTLGLLYYSKLSCGEWDKLKSLFNIIKNNLSLGKVSLTPFTAILSTADPNLQYLAAKNFSDKYINTKLKVNRDFKKNINHQKIRIAYLSSDFYNHATSHLIAGLFENQNKEKFDYYAFSYGKLDNSKIARRVKSSFNNFFDIEAQSDEEISKILYNHEIDIVVDLKGHTKNNRLKCLSTRPCPVQISYLGFPGSLGTDFIDYLIMDSFIVNKNNRSFFNENIVYLPNSYQCNENKPKILLSKKDLNLPDDKIILCSLNNAQKYNIKLLNIWAQILIENPNTILWLLDDNKIVIKNIINFFINKKINKSRIVFATRTDTKTHISRMVLADIYLDSYPCNAHTSASDALQANLPIVTISGNSMSSRVTGSLLKTINAEELICQNYSEYKKKINFLINNKSALSKIRDKIRKNKNKNLFNSKLFAINLEKAYEKIWKIFLNGKKIADIKIK